MAHKLCWATDIHLDFLSETVQVGSKIQGVLSETKVKDFCDQIMAMGPDSLVITGDISQAPAIELHLMWLEKHLPIPVRFVLGNHDYYNGSIKEVRSRMLKYDGTKTRTGWLNVMGIVPLTEETALIGHDGWYDGGYSNWFQSRLVMNEYSLTEEFKYERPTQLHAKLQGLAQECANHIERYMTEGAKKYKSLVFATHVPPFRENSRAPNHELSDKDWLPNMSSKKAGDALLKIAKAFPGVQVTCLSGHTHTQWTQRYTPNLVCMTGQAEYGYPEASIQLLEVE